MNCLHHADVSRLAEELDTFVDNIDSQNMIQYGVDKWRYVQISLYDEPWVLEQVGNLRTVMMFSRAMLNPRRQTKADVLPKFEGHFKRVLHRHDDNDVDVPITWIQRNAPKGVYMEETWRDRFFNAVYSGRYLPKTAGLRAHVAVPGSLLLGGWPVLS